ncbi:MAG: transcription elongation factor GreA [Bacteroidetes bacterium]|nr:MAG: transcription elongation factor GreA [Bacteroidota bacterium]
MKVSYYTLEGLDNLKNELKNLERVERPSLSKQIAEARDKGDLSENAEYHAAKEAQGFLELKISKLQEVVRNARIIDESKLDASKVLLFSKVKIKNLNNGMEMTYTLVPEQESNMKEAKISVTSPMAKGLLGKEVGATTEIKVPAGTIPFEIVEISR